MNYGIGGSVGASAASGLQAGFNMGLAATAQEDTRKQREFENKRQTTQDQQRADQITRTNAAADKASAEHDDDRAMVGHVAERDDLRYQLGAARAASPDGTLSRDVADPLYAKIRDNHGRISVLNAKKAQPIIDATQQKWRDFASKAESGQADPSTLRGQDLRDFIKANTGHDLADFANGKVGGAIDDATAGMQSGNMGMAVRAAGTLLKPHINQKLGGPAADGSMIVDKDLYALVPAPAQTPQVPATPPLKGLMDMLNQGMQPGQNASVQPPAAGAAQPPQPGMQPGQQAPVQPSGPPPLQPGTDPNLLMPVLDVTTRQPDGTLTKYHAPVTQDRSADPDAPHAQPLKMTDLTDRMGRLGVLDKWLKQPEMQDAVKEALASKPTTYEQMWAMVHGDPTNLTGDGAKDATSLKIAAGKKLAKELGVSFADAMRQIDGKGTTGVQARIDAIDDSDMSDKDKAQAKRVAYGIEKVAAPKVVTPKVAAPNAVSDANGVGAGLHGQALLDSLKPGEASIVKALADGRMQSTDLSTKGGHRERMLGLANQYKEDYNTSDAKTSAAIEKGFTSGQQGKTVRAMNTAVDHLSTLGSLADALNNKDTTGINKIKNAAAAWLGDADVSNFDTAKRIVADEVVKAIVGSGGALADREAAEKTIMNSQSPAQLKGTIQTYQKLMGGQLTSLRTQYESGQGKRNFNDFLTPGAQAALGSANPAAGRAPGTGITGSPATYASEQEAASAAAAGKLKPGDRITINGQTGTWH